MRCINSRFTYVLSYFTYLQYVGPKSRFSSTAAQIWNHIPTAIRDLPSLDSFKHHLKTHYFASS